MVVKKQDLSLVSYILGIISIVMAIISDFGIGGIIFGIIGLKINKDKKDPYYALARKLNKIGLILGIIIFVISAVAAYLLSIGVLT